MRRSVVAAVLAMAAAARLAAHDGPPFPILSDHAAGPYTISIWTDPDATSDGSPGGQFWVLLKGRSGALPRETRAQVTVTPRTGGGRARTARTEPVRGDVTNQFAALVLDREGPFAVTVGIEGPLGAAGVDASVDATYDLRPPPYMLGVYVLPFVAVGVLWARLLLVRRRAAARRPQRSPGPAGP